MVNTHRIFLVGEADGFGGEAFHIPSYYSMSEKFCSCYLPAGLCVWVRDGSPDLTALSDRTFYADGNVLYLYFPTRQHKPQECGY